MPDQSQRVVRRASVPREERSRRAVLIGKSEVEGNGSEGTPYTAASFCAEALYVGTSVWHRNARAIANRCWKRS